MEATSLCFSNGSSKFLMETKCAKIAPNPN